MSTTNGQGAPGMIMLENDDETIVLGNVIFSRKEFDALKTDISKIIKLANEHGWSNTARGELEMVLHQLSYKSTSIGERSYEKVT